MMFATGSEFLLPDHWEMGPEADERFRGLCEIMVAICDAFDLTTCDEPLRDHVKHFPNQYPLVPPMALAEAMQWCVENIRLLTQPQPGSELTR